MLMSHLHTSSFYVGFEDLNSGQGGVASVLTTEPSPEPHFLFFKQLAACTAVGLLVPEPVAGCYDSLTSETPQYTLWGSSPGLK